MTEYMTITEFLRAVTAEPTLTEIALAWVGWIGRVLVKAFEISLIIGIYSLAWEIACETSTGQAEKRSNDVD